MVKTNKRLILFTENFEKRILAEGIENAQNLESFLNNEQISGKNRITLRSVTSYYKNKNGGYTPKDHNRDVQILNVNHIDFIYGDSNLIYSQNHQINPGEASLLWGMKGLHHALIGEVSVPMNHVPKITICSKEERLKQELTLINYLDKKLQKNFITFYNPRAKGPDAKEEFESLFKGIHMDPTKIKRILINNKKQSLSSTSQAIYLGLDSKNYSR